MLILRWMIVGFVCIWGGGLQVDKRALEFYQIVVKRQQPHLACTLLGYCNKRACNRQQGKPMSL